jgi:hypothetical protein
VLVLSEIERRLGIAERLAGCIAEPRAPERVRHGLAEMIRFRSLLIAAGFPDANDCDALRDDPAFEMAVGRLPEKGPELFSQPTISRLEDLLGPTALKRMMVAMVDLFCDSFEQVPRRIPLDIDDRWTACTAASNCRCSMRTMTAAASRRCTSTRQRPASPWR